MNSWLQTFTICAVICFLLTGCSQPCSHADTVIRALKEENEKLKEHVRNHEFNANWWREACFEEQRKRIHYQYKLP